MSEAVFAIALVGGLLVSLVAIIIGIWANPRKGIPGWIMAASSVFLLFGLIGLSGILIMEHWTMLDWINEDTVWGFTFLCLTGTAALFTSGFLWDRIRRFRIAGS